MLVRQVEKLDAAVHAPYLHLMVGGWDAGMKMLLMLLMLSRYVSVDGGTHTRRRHTYVDLFDERVYGLELQLLELPLRVIERGPLGRRVVVVIFVLLAVGRVAAALGVQLERFKVHARLLR